MAVTSLWKIKGRIDNAINYIEDPDKTDGSLYSQADLQSLQDVMDYATDPDKTELRMYVTGINVTPDNARYMMMQTKEQYNKKDGIAAFHGYQSFAEDEVTPSVAHEIGVKLAEELWGDRFEVVVATHLNTNHIHNHFVLNSVSFVDGKKFYDNKETKRLMRDTSDKLCREYGLSVIENPQGRGKHYAEWKAEQQGMPTIRGRIREELDEIIGKSQTYIQFKELLYRRGYGYKLGPNVKHGAVKPPYSQRFVRLRSLGEDYTEERIKERIVMGRNGIRRLSKPKEPKHYKVKGSFSNAKNIKLKGFMALYFHYLYLFKKIRRKQAPPKVTYYMREELIKLERYKAQFMFLHKNSIETMEQLQGKRAEATARITELTKQRQKLYGKKNEEREQIPAINAELKELRKTVRMCNNIEQDAVRIDERSQKVKQIQAELEKNAIRRREYER